MEYSVREKDEYENSIIIYVKMPETGKELSVDRRYKNLPAHFKASAPEKEYS